MAQSGIWVYQKTTVLQAQAKVSSIERICLCFRHIVYMTLAYKGLVAKSNTIAKAQAKESAKAPLLQAKSNH
jgi:hypothetical protein